MDVGQLDPVGPWWRCGGLITIYFSDSVKHLLTCGHRCGTYIYMCSECRNKIACAGTDSLHKGQNCA